MLYCIPKPCLEINSATATAKIAEVTRYAIGSLKNSNRHAESISNVNDEETHPPVPACSRYDGGNGAAHLCLEQ